MIHVRSTSSSNLRQTKRLYYSSSTQSTFTHSQRTKTLPTKSRVLRRVISQPRISADSSYQTPSTILKNPNPLWPTSEFEYFTNPNRLKRSGNESSQLAGRIAKADAFLSTLKKSGTQKISGRVDSRVIESKKSTFKAAPCTKKKSRANTSKARSDDSRPR